MNSLPTTPVFGLKLLRLFTSQSIESSHLLKSRLRQLYKKVHPDLFEADPPAKETNERSFKLLQEYLAAAKQSGRGMGGSASLPYCFTFHVKRESAESLKDAKDHEEGANMTEVVSITIPPPNRVLPGETIKALSRLFVNCGIEGLSELGDYGHGRPHTAGLLKWLPGAVELVHRISHGGPRHELHAVKVALKLAQGITLVFGDDFAHASALEQLESARSLLKILDLSPGAFMGLKLGLGLNSGVDSVGVVWLDAKARPSDWAEYLQTVDLTWCRQRMTEAADLRKKERDIAESLGIASIFPHPALTGEETYAKFLARLSDALFSQGSADQRHDGQDISIRVLPEDGSAAQSTVVDEYGKILVPVTASGPAVLKMLRLKSAEATTKAASVAKEDKELATLQKQVERKLRLRRLLRHPDLPAHKFRAGCLRLLQQSEKLAPLLDGMSIRLAEVNHVHPDVSFIDVSWLVIL